MGLETQRRYRVFFSQKEATAGAANSTCQFEGRGEMTLPEPTWMQESDKGKLGSGEHGLATKLQAAYTTFSYKTQRLSEIAYLLSYYTGNTDRYITIASGVYMHELTCLRTHNRTLPTFTIEYGDGSTNKKIVGCVVNSFSLNFASGGTGVIEATFEGWGNRHYLSSGIFTELAAGSMSSGALTLTGEPLVNFKSCRVWIADSLESNFGITSISTGGENLGTNLIEMTSLINSITVGGENGRTADDTMRCGGYGIINDFTRGDRTLTMEIGFRKDDSTIDPYSYITGNSGKAIEIQFCGAPINGSREHAMILFLPAIQFTGAPQNGETPISRAATFEICQDSDGDAFIAFFQTGVASGYNA